MDLQGRLVGRLRDLLVDEATVREVSMFGGRAFMVREKLIVSALGNGGLLVRVKADRHGTLVERPGARQAEMGAGRSMGPGWIEVAGSSIADERDLSFWVSVALERNRAVDGTTA